MIWASTYAYYTYTRSDSMGSEYTRNMLKYTYIRLANLVTYYIFCSTKKKK